MLHDHVSCVELHSHIISGHSSATTHLAASHTRSSCGSKERREGPRRQHGRNQPFVTTSRRTRAARTSRRFCVSTSTTTPPPIQLIIHFSHIDSARTSGNGGRGFVAQHVEFHGQMARGADPDHLSRQQDYHGAIGLHRVDASNAQNSHEDVQGW